ncbi:MAG: restriction endonuclease subunit S [Candidatus Absconditabacterales bacterium]|nr:restriction endonuclease subunit S [Candidatus Absconditabacterales bacterium]
MTTQTTHHIPPGYKLTELGVIPVDWEVKKLGDVGNICMCKRIMKYQTKAIGDVPFYKIGTFGKEADAYIDNQIYYDYKRKYPFPKQGEILISVSGTIGRTVIYDGLPAYFQDSNIIWLDNDEKMVSNKFLFYLYKIISWKTEDTTISRLYNDNFKKTQICIPPTIEEQQSIATALSDIDTLITSLKDLISKKQAIKQGMMQLLLTGKKRLPGFHGERKIKKIIDIGELTGAGVDKKINPDEEFVRLLNYMDVYRRDFIYSNELNHLVTAPKSKIIQCSVKKGDVFFTPSSELQNDIAHSAVAMEDMEQVTYSYHVYRLRTKDERDCKFKAYAFKTQFFYQQAEKTAEGSGKRYVISLTKFRQLEIFYPQDIREQQAIATILSDMDAEIASLQAQQNKYKNIKQGMMQQLLTGKIRLI